MVVVVDELVVGVTEEVVEEVEVELLDVVLSEEAVVVDVLFSSAAVEVDVSAAYVVVVTTGVTTVIFT